MSCCGKIRQSQFNPSYRSPGSPIGAVPPASMRRSFAVCFEYVGRTGLTVQGPVSGQVYRFDGPGARLVVDPRDQLSLAAVPVLRLVDSRSG